MIQFSITFTPDLAYYQEAYDEIVSSKRLKKYEPFLAIIMILFGIGLWFSDTTRALGIFPFVFSGFGIYELIKVFYSRRKWINDRMKSQVAGEEITLLFTDEYLDHKGPFTTGKMNWAGIHSIVETKKGLILRPQNGVIIYLPKRLFHAEEHIQLVLSKASGKAEAEGSRES